MFEFRSSQYHANRVKLKLTGSEIMATSKPSSPSLADRSAEMDSQYPDANNTLFSLGKSKVSKTSGLVRYSRALGGGGGEEGGRVKGVGVVEGRVEQEENMRDRGTLFLRQSNFMAD